MGVSPDRFFRGNFEITYKMGLQKKNRFLGGNFEITYSKRVLGLGLGLTWGWGWGWVGVGVIRGLINYYAKIKPL